MSAILETYRDQLWRRWMTVRSILMDLEELTPPRDELQRRIEADGFDGGRTAAWAQSLTTAGRAVWRSVCDRRTGHTVHCLSDRRAEELTPDLVLGLRLMSWMRASGPAITWFWWDQPWARRMPARVEPSRDHLNGGWAVPGVPEVHVYRREEAHKVMLHETVHALKMDVPADMLDPVRSTFERDLGGRRLWPHIGEAYTELLAEWLWAIAGSKSFADTRRRWRLQRECARNQAAIVWSRIRESTATENTNVFAYYILKYVLMLHEDDVLLSPVASVPMWVSWWLTSRSELDRIAVLARQSGSDNHAISMGMTCGYT
jgi:hypothetical protein